MRACVRACVRARARSGRMTDRNKELVPDNVSLIRVRALTTGLCSEGRYSEHSGVCRRAKLPGRSVKVKKSYYKNQLTKIRRPVLHHCCLLSGFKICMKQGGSV